MIPRIAAHRLGRWPGVEDRPVIRGEAMTRNTRNHLVVSTWHRHFRRQQTHGDQMRRLNLLRRAVAGTNAMAQAQTHAFGLIKGIFVAPEYSFRRAASGLRRTDQRQAARPGSSSTARPNRIKLVCGRWRTAVLCWRRSSVGQMSAAIRLFIGEWTSRFTIRSNFPASWPRYSGTAEATNRRPRSLMKLKIKARAELTARAKLFRQTNSVIPRARRCRTSRQEAGGGGR